MEASEAALAERAGQLEEQFRLASEERDKAVGDVEHAMRRASLAEAALDAAKRRVKCLERRNEEVEGEIWERQKKVKEEREEAEREEEGMRGMMAMHEDEVAALKTEQRSQITLTSTNARTNYIHTYIHTHTHIPQRGVA